MSEARPVVRIHPEPTEEEAAVIVAAIHVLGSRVEPGESPKPERSRWAEAGRREAMRGLDDDA